MMQAGVGGSEDGCIGMVDMVSRERRPCLVAQIVSASLII